jgi:hypothetical protein
MTEIPNASAPEEAHGGDRGRSTIEFPYFDLDDAVATAKAVHGLGGDKCEKDQLAARLQMAAKGGGFSIKLSTARVFGLLQLERGQVMLTELGIRVCDTQQEKAARIDAFLTVPLYKSIYEKFKGTSLPPTSGLEGAIQALGVAPKQKDKARQAFQRSAKQAGFFDMSIERLVMPPTGGHNDGKPSNGGKSPSANAAYQKPLGEEPARHPFIQGLLETLPQVQTEWAIEDRAKWLQGAAGIFDVIYKDTSGSGMRISVLVNKS